ncbi:MAG: hypothetical protein IT558_00730 [Alphaproteobacteria bacterium]|nr:hypothetical protein [Alphaproteobacteria bacterium]
MQRPQRVTYQSQVVREKAPITDPAMKDIPLAYIMAVKNNEALEPCCRDLDNMQVELQKTDPALDGPNKLVIECGSCGRKHIRFVGGTSDVKAGNG